MDFGSIPFVARATPAGPPPGGPRNALIPGSAADTFALNNIWANSDFTGARTLSDDGLGVLSATDTAGSVGMTVDAGTPTLSVSGDNYQVVLGSPARYTGNANRTAALTGDWAIFARVRCTDLSGAPSIFRPNGPNGDIILFVNAGVVSVGLWTGSAVESRTGQTIGSTPVSIVIEREAGVALRFYVSGQSMVSTSSISNAADLSGPPSIGFPNAGLGGVNSWEGGIGSVGIMSALPGATLRDKFLTGPLEASDMSAFDHFWPL